jgi:hypothetical protein
VYAASKKLIGKFCALTLYVFCLIGHPKKPNVYEAFIKITKKFWLATAYRPSLPLLVRCGIHRSTYVPVVRKGHRRHRLVDAQSSVLPSISSLSFSGIFAAISPKNENRAFLDLHPLSPLEEFRLNQTLPQKSEKISPCVACARSAFPICTFNRE